MSNSILAVEPLSGNPCTDPRLPCDDDCILPYTLRRRAENLPNETFVAFEDGQVYSNAEMLRRARAFGAGLRAYGLGVGDKVLVWMPNGPLALTSWCGINMIGAVFVAINTSYKGKLLEHVVTNSGAATMVCHPDLADRLLELPKTPRLRTVFTSPEKAQRDALAFAAAGFDLRSWDSLLDCAPDDTLPVQDLKPWTLQSVCYTSGTTGPSKGVMSSYLHLHTMGFECTAGTDASDRWLINLPLFHAGGTLFVAGALARGTSIALLSGFETTSFLSKSRELGATACVLLGAMASFLLRQPAHNGDREHHLRRVMILPLNEDSRIFRERFGFDVYTVFNMSEVSCPIRSEDNPSERGSCGRLRPGVEARIVDEHDCEVAIGQVGELVLRADCPWTMSHGYLENPEATAQAWRNGWFHTGDGFRQDQDGNYFFVDRIKDAIRRRGENISSFEVESEVLTHPSVLEAAAVGVPSEFGEEDVLIAVVLKPDAAASGENLLQHLSSRMSHFMIPRYVRFMEELPKTPTSKVEKHKLRSEGITSDTWDRETAGVRILRDRLKG